MGGFANTLGGLSALNQSLGLVSNFISGGNRQDSQSLALQQLQQRQALNAQNLAQRTAQEREQIAAQSQANEQTRRRALRRAVARQRAQFGGSGVGNTGGGSQEAVLLGLFDETQEQLDQRERLDGLRNSALDLGASQQRSLNLLQLQQLSQRQNIGRVSTGLDRASDFINFGFGTGGLFR